MADELTNIYLEDLVYYKSESDATFDAEQIRVDTALDTKADLDLIGTPSGACPLDNQGDVPIINIPVATQTEADDENENAKLMTPEKVHYLLSDYNTKDIASGLYGDLKSDGSVTMYVSYNPQAQTDLATVKFVQDSVIGTAQNFIVNTLVEMLALTGVKLADTCFVIADTDPNNNAEYRALKDDPAFIEDWNKVDSDIAWGSLIGLLSDQTDLQAALNDKGDKAIVDTNTLAIVNIQAKTDYITVAQDVNLDSMEANIATNAADIVLVEADIVTLETEVGNLASLNTTIKTDLVSATNEVNTNTINNAADIAILQAPQDAMIMTDMTGSEPATADGQFYYANNCLNMGNAYGTNLQIGQEVYTEVANASGATIVEGAAVYQMGVSGGLPAIGLALADSYSTSIVIGIATMDIAHGATGLVTTFGNVNGLNTNGIATDVLVYLSDVVAGGMTVVAPNIATVIGTVLLADLTAGVINVRIRSNIALPTIFAGIKTATSPTSLPADLGNPTPIQNYSNYTNVVMTYDANAGEINCAIDGTYRVNISVDLVFDNVGGAGKKEIYLGVRNTTTNSLIDEIRGFILKDAETYSFSSNSLVDLVAGNNYALELRSEIALTNLTFSQSSFDLESVHIR
ncbi:MAG: hypothetical protein DRQ78_10750 [Epsilonproteobacteria bacterium]|nr:MAG: hypothetical protein DRQ78_10750 [Campylobacterota bacterium]